MLYTELKRIERLKRLLEKIAYGSLVLDVLTAIATLVSLRIYSRSVLSFLFYLNVALSVEVVVAVIVFLTIVVMSHYDKVIDKIAELSFRIRRKTK